MSQFGAPFDQPAVEQKTSGLAVTAFVCGLLGCCPFVTSGLAVILGVASFVTIGKNPALKGRGFAGMGLLLGLIGLVAWIWLSIVGGAYLKRVMEFIIEGPETALQAAFNNDPATFRSMCWGDAAAASDDEVLSFAAELRDRYGALVACEMPQSGGQQSTFGQQTVPFPYVLRFERATLDAEVEITFGDPQVGFVDPPKISSITVFDDERGDVVFPPPPAGVDEGPPGAAGERESPPEDSDAEDP